MAQTPIRSAGPRDELSEPNRGQFPDSSGMQTPTRSKDVLVACKVATGLILRIMEVHPDVDQKGVTSMLPVYASAREVRVRGPAVRIELRPTFEITHGYAVTPVERSFWDEWLKRNASSAVVRSGFISAFDTIEDLRAYARERGQERSGMEPIDQDKPMPGLRKLSTGYDEDVAA